MRPIEFYIWATAQAGQAITEAEQRTVVSRLYYGLHHEACCRYFRRNPTAPPLGKGNRHAGLSITFNASSDATSKNIANLLKDLRDIRVQADYELSTQLNYRGNRINWESLVKIAMVYGQDLMEELENYSPGEASDGCPCLVL